MSMTARSDVKITSFDPLGRMVDRGDSGYVPAVKPATTDNNTTPAPSNSSSGGTGSGGSGGGGSGGGGSGGDGDVVKPIVSGLRHLVYLPRARPLSSKEITAFQQVYTTLFRKAVESVVVVKQAIVRDPLIPDLFSIEAPATTDVVVRIIKTMFFGGDSNLYAISPTLATGSRLEVTSIVTPHQGVSAASVRDVIAYNQASLAEDLAGVTGVPSADASSVAAAAEYVTLPSMCFNNVIDGSESDVDCGGSSCVQCEDGKKCNDNLDCLSLSCASNACYSWLVSSQGTRLVLSNAHLAIINAVIAIVAVGIASGVTA